MSKTEEKKAPTSLKRGMPPEQANGLFGSEDRIMALGVKGRLTAVVTIEVADVVHSDADGTARPVVEFVHIEPMWSEESANVARTVQEVEYKERTGANQLNFDGIGTDPEQSAADDDAAFDAAAPKSGKK